jgi:8-oxo-dGTP pyrophosphatase MutT (NUDIX family)
LSELQKWQVLSQETISDNPWNGLRREVVRLPDGSVVDDYFVSLRPHVVVVFALTPERQVVLVRQYKHGVREITTELPAGTFANGDAVEHALRELREETGYVAAYLEPLATAYAESTRSDGLVYCYLAREATWAGEQQLDENESRSGLEVLSYPLDEVARLIAAGVIKDQASLLCAVLALQALG